MRRLKDVIFLSDYDHADVKAWSGINYHLLKELKKKSNLIDVGKVGIPIIVKAYFFLVKTWVKICLKKKYLYQRTALYSYFITRDIRKKLSLSPGVPIITTSSMIAGCVKGNKSKIILYIDATFFQMIDYYPEFSNLWGKNISYGIQQENNAFKKASKIFVASNWSERSIVNDYGIHKSKVTVVGLPQNVSERHLLRQVCNPRPYAADISILFVGVDWLRKGGDVAVELCDYLESEGVKVHLSVVGCALPKGYERDYIRCFGFLSKNNESQSESLNKLFGESDILLVPSRYECFGIVYAEAASYGLVPVGNRTGGANDAIVNSGFCLDFFNDKQRSFEIIRSIVERPRLDELRLNCFAEIRSTPRSYEIVVNKFLNEVS